MNQAQALSILKTGVNVFLTGEPGSGKTHTVNQYISYLHEHGLSVAVTASTGIAATHLGGMTIHSWSGVGIHTEFTKRDLELLKLRRGLSSRVQKTVALIVDEISMLDARVLTAVDTVLRYLREDDRPFGGLQVIFVGDFFQLPPISRNNASVEFAFESQSWKDAEPVVCYLSEQHRQMDAKFTQLLNSIRSGHNASEDYELLLERQVATPVNSSITRLYSHNLDVDTLNNQKLLKLSGEVKQFRMSGSGRKNLIEQLQKGCLSPELLQLKPGAQVMFTKNDFEAGVVNGTLGQVIGFNNNLPVVETNQGQRITVAPTEWAIKDDQKTVASITQIPLRLAWAITVHKSQGMTLDKAVIDLSRAFAYGQGYVAISRVRSFEGLFLAGINDRALLVHPQILEVDQEFRNQSYQAELELNRLDQDQLGEKQNAYIEKMGESKDNHLSNAKTNTYTQTYELFTQGKDITEIAQIRKLKDETIISHLEKLRSQGKLTKSDVLRVIPKHLEISLPQIHHEFLKAEYNKLAPVFYALKERFTYYELRLARLVL